MVQNPQLQYINLQMQSLTPRLGYSASVTSNNQVVQGQGLPNSQLNYLRQSYQGIPQQSNVKTDTRSQISNSNQKNIVAAQQRMSLQGFDRELFKSPNSSSYVGYNYPPNTQRNQYSRREQEQELRLSLGHVPRHVQSQNITSRGVSQKSEKSKSQMKDMMNKKAESVQKVNIQTTSQTPTHGQIDKIVQLMGFKGSPNGSRSTSPSKQNTGRAEAIQHSKPTLQNLPIANSMVEFSTPLEKVKGQGLRMSLPITLGKEKSKTPEFTQQDIIIESPSNSCFLLKAAGSGMPSFRCMDDDKVVQQATVKTEPSGERQVRSKSQFDTRPFQNFEPLSPKQIQGKIDDQNAQPITRISLQIPFNQNPSPKTSPKISDRASSPHLSAKIKEFQDRINSKNLKPPTPTQQSSDVGKMRSLTVYEKEPPTFQYEIDTIPEVLDDKPDLKISITEDEKETFAITKVQSCIKENRRNPSLDLQIELFNDMGKYRKSTATNQTLSRVSSRAMDNSKENMSSQPRYSYTPDKLNLDLKLEPRQSLPNRNLKANEDVSNLVTSRESIPDKFEQMIKQAKSVESCLIQVYSPSLVAQGSNVDISNVLNSPRNGQTITSQQSQTQEELDQDTTIQNNCTTNILKNYSMETQTSGEPLEEKSNGCLKLSLKEEDRPISPLEVSFQDKSITPTQLSLSQLGLSRSDKIESDSQRLQQVDEEWVWSTEACSEHIRLDGKIANNKTEFDAPIMVEPQLNPQRESWIALRIFQLNQSVTFGLVDTSITTLESIFVPKRGIFCIRNDGCVFSNGEKVESKGLQMRRGEVVIMLYKPDKKKLLCYTPKDQCEISIEVKPESKLHFFSSLKKSLVMIPNL